MSEAQAGGWAFLDKSGHWCHRLIASLCLAAAAMLATSSLLQDSITYDETSKLTAGMSYLETGDFRLGHDHPPLGKMWAACPLLLVDPEWPPPETLGWREGSVWHVGWTWLFVLNDGERLLAIARCMVVVLLLATCLCVYAMARALFGARGGLLGLLLATLSPTLLAHGRLVTTDMPLTLCMCTTLLTFARLMSRITWPRLLATVLSVGALSLTKFAWPLILPALATMAVVMMVRSGPIPCALVPQKLCGTDGQKSVLSQLTSRRQRAVAVAVICIFTAGGTWATIWTCFGWRYSPFRGDDARSAILLPDVRSVEDLPANMDEAWRMVLHRPDGTPIGGVGADFVRWARAARFLPEAYLFGLAYTLKSTGARTAYLNGEFSNTGWRSYFLIAFAIKTPIPTMLLLVVGLAALITRRAPLGRDPVLMVGIVVTAVVYGGFAIASNMNIGHRYLLPIYPAVMVLAGASAAWSRSRVGRWIIVLAVVWVLVEDLRIHPHYLSYFNSFVGGARNGHRHLADSNIDWGQDLKRLASYARRHSDETIKLAYFGSGDPRKYGFDCEVLHHSVIPFASPADLTAGTYVISVTHLLGVYWSTVRDAYWDRPDLREKYRLMGEYISQPPPGDATEEMRRDHLRLTTVYRGLQLARLVNGLRRRPPDDRIGYSLFVYRLRQADVGALTAP